jgi:hypothetical protein
MMNQYYIYTFLKINIIYEQNSLHYITFWFLYYNAYFIIISCKAEVAVVGDKLDRIIVFLHDGTWPELLSYCLSHGLVKQGSKNNLVYGRGDF